MASNPKTVALILGKMRGGPPPAAGQGADGAPDDEIGEGYKAAADEAMQALKADDAEAFARALKSFVGMCSSEG